MTMKHRSVQLRIKGKSDIFCLMDSHAKKPSQSSFQSMSSIKLGVKIYDTIMIDFEQTPIYHGPSLYALENVLMFFKIFVVE